MALEEKFESLCEELISFIQELAFREDMTGNEIVLLIASTLAVIVKLSIKNEQ